MDEFRGDDYNTAVVPTLHLIATPIGNLEDISLRALRLLREVKLIAAEDTRTTRQLLTFYNIKTPVTSYHEHNKRQKLNYLLGCLKEKDVALVSEAGMPGLSDPGYELVVAAIQQGFPVVPVPGATAIVAALVVSGLPVDRFLYLGFLPRRQGQKLRLLRAVAEQPHTLVAFEAPHRLQATLRDAVEILGDRRVAICRELTKLHEEVFRGRLSEALEHFRQPRGEFTLVIEGKEVKSPELTDEVERELKSLYERGLRAKEAIVQLSRTTGLSRRKLYQTWLKLIRRG